MADTSSPSRTRSPVTWLGLFVALFGILIARQIVTYFLPGHSFAASALKEVGMWIVALALIAIIKLGERLPLQSVGIGTTRLAKSILWGVIIAVICIAAAVLLIAVTGYTGGEGGKFMEALPVWMILLIVIRAGVVEELCYRGYAIERLHALGFPRWVGALVPLAIFAVAHWTGGWANILIALVLGAILAAFYIWRRDLVANMIGHFLVDFVGNVLPKLGG